MNHLFDSCKRVKNELQLIQIYLYQFNNGQIACVYDNAIKLYEAPDYALAHTLRKQINNPNNVVQLKNSDIAFASGKNIEIWNDTLTKHLSTIKNSYDDAIYYIIQLQDNMLLTSSKGTFRIWSTPPTQIITQVKGHEQDITCILQLKNRQIVTASDDKSIKLWRMNDFKCIASFEHAEMKKVFSLIQLNEKQLAVGTLMQIIIADLSGLKCIQILDKGLRHLSRLIRMTNGDFICCKGKIQIRDMRFKQKAVMSNGRNEKRIIDAIELKDKRIVSISSERELEFWTLQKKQAIIQD